MTTSITKDDLLNFTHQLHCKLRGAKGIKLTGLPALNEIENILFFRFIEEREEILNISDDIKFTTICMILVIILIVFIATLRRILF